MHAEGMPMQRFAGAEPRPRKPSVSAARVRATLHKLHTQGLSRSPQTVPLNTEARRPNVLVSGLCIRKKARKAPLLGGGGCVGGCVGGWI
jgi:hypothetical protein